MKDLEGKSNGLGLKEKMRRVQGGGELGVALREQGSVSWWDGVRVGLEGMQRV